MLKTVLKVGIFAVGLSLFSNGGYIEVKDADGTYRYVEQSSAPLYVCYDRRIKVAIDGRYYLKYEGCIRTSRSCRSLGMAHFGHYPNTRESYRALKRCRNATPRFID